MIAGQGGYNIVRCDVVVGHQVGIEHDFHGVTTFAHNFRLAHAIDGFKGWLNQEGKQTIPCQFSL